MTHIECINSDSKEAQRVKEILAKIEKAKLPDDLIMYQILKEA